MSHFGHLVIIKQWSEYNVVLKKEWNADLTD